MQPRSIGLDIIKGICIILMVIGHSGAPDGLRHLIASFHMPAFFIISGFLLKEKYLHDSWGFIKRKLKTLWWPFFMWTAIFILLHNIFHGLGLYADPYSLKDHAIHLVKGAVMTQTEQLLGGFWFLRALLIACIASILWLRVCGMNLISLIGGIAGALAIAAMMLAGWIPAVGPIDHLAFQATAFFLTGTLMQRYRFAEVQHRWAVIACALACVTIGGFWLRKAMTLVDPVTVIPYYITASLISWGMIVLFWYTPAKGIWKYLVEIGSRTLDILIWHFLALKLISVVKILHLGLDWSHMADFPVVKTQNGGGVRQ